MSKQGGVNQQIMRKIRAALSTEQQEYFQRVFCKDESPSELHRDIESEEAGLLMRALRSPALLDTQDATN